MLMSVKKWVTKMFMGEFKHNIDAKGRLIIPSKLREQCGSSVIVTRGFDGCLALYTQEGWNDYYQKLQMLPKTKKDARNFVRIIIRGFKIEKNGDICIMYSWPTSPRKIEKMYDLSRSMYTKIEIVGVYA